jgi:hypothetical protein
MEVKGGLGAEGKRGMVAAGWAKAQITPPKFLGGGGNLHTGVEQKKNTILLVRKVSSRA